MKGLLRDGDQLVLGLWVGEPWQGSSPRTLTRAAQLLFSKRKLPEATRYWEDPEQLEFWPADGLHFEKGPGRDSSGAPLLLEPFSHEEEWYAARTR